MAEHLFLDWTVSLLEKIEASQEKKTWCRRYSVYSSTPGQEELLRDLKIFMVGVYENGLVISNYQEVFQR